MDSNEYRLGLYEKAMPNYLTWREKLIYCKKFGFDWLEISIDETDEKLKRLEWSKEEINAIKVAMEETGISIDTMCLSGHRKYPLGSLIENDVQRSMEIMEKAIDLAKELGIRIIQLAGYDVYYSQGNENTKKQFINNLKKSVKLASAKGILMGFETMETPFMDTVGKAMEYVNEINSPYLHVYPDIGNLTNSSKIYHHDIIDDIELGIGHIVATHLKETKPNCYREIPYGTGHTDFTAVIQCLKNLGVRMFVGEFWFVGQVDWEQDCYDANKFLREKIDNVFKN